MSSTGVGASADGIVDGNNSNDGTRGGGSGPCGACKFLRRKCTTQCIFAPYFDSEHGVANFAGVHKVFGASNVSKLLHQIPPLMRSDAIFSICYEAQARLLDPIYGCTNQIKALHEQVMSLQSELINIQTRIANMVPPTNPTFVTQPQMPMNDALPVYNLSSSSNILQTQDGWVPQQQEPQQLHQHQFAHGGSDDIAIDSDLQAMALELLNEMETGDGAPPPCTHQ